MNASIPETGKEDKVVYKLRLEKAYDRANWDFLHYLMRRMGFGPRKWLLECLRLATFSILLNGSPKGYLSASRGLCQGDLLSPFLFVIFFEVLIRMSYAATDANLIAGFESHSYNHGISHLQFANDTRPRVIFFKRGIIGIRVNEDHLARLADILGCKIGSLPYTYLGLPFSILASSCSPCSLVLERLKMKLSLWKTNYLSLGGRIILIKVALANLLIY